MSFKHKDSSQEVLKQLWGSSIPALSPEEIDLSVKVWQKIQNRKQREKHLS